MNYLLKYYFENELGKMLQFFSGFSIDWIDVSYVGADTKYGNEVYSIEVCFKYSSLLLKHTRIIYETYKEMELGEEEDKKDIEKVLNSFSNKLTATEKEIRRKEAKLNAKEN